MGFPLQNNLSQSRREYGQLSSSTGTPRVLHVRRFLPGNYSSFETALLQRMAAWNMEVIFHSCSFILSEHSENFSVHSRALFSSALSVSRITRQFLAAFCLKTTIIFGNWCIFMHLY